MRQKGFALIIILLLLAAAVSLSLTAIIFISKLQNSKTESDQGQKVSDRKIEQILVEGSWTISLGQEGLPSDWVYKFFPDGNYTQQLYTDTFTKPSSGKWRIVPEGNKNKLIHEPLDNSKRCYWLPCEVFVEYDSASDELLVSGANLVGAPRLKHSK